MVALSKESPAIPGRAGFKNSRMIITKDMIDKQPVDNKDLWGTPWPIFNKLQDEMPTEFSLDPCATIETAKVEYFFTPKDDGLSRSWLGHVVFCNPPYSRGSIDLWVRKCYEERNKALVVALLPVSTSADWYQNYICGKQEVWFVNKRIKFNGATWTAPFSSMIVIFNNKNIHRCWDQP